MQWNKFIILIIMLAIIVSLFSGLFFLVKDEGRSKRTANALTLRIALSLFLIAVLILGWYLGWISFHQISLR